MTRRVQIDRLELDMRGIPPATAETAARLFGPALAQALGRGNIATGLAKRIDAGQLSSADARDPQAIATQIAGHIARRLGGRS